MERGQIRRRRAKAEQRPNGRVEGARAVELLLQRAHAPQQLVALRHERSNGGGGSGRGSIDLWPRFFSERVWRLARLLAQVEKRAHAPIVFSLPFFINLCMPQRAAARCHKAAAAPASCF